MRIEDIKISIISDSRDKDTLEAEMFSGKISVKASVPAGKSRGIHEAFVMEPERAKSLFESEVKDGLMAKDFKDQEDFDSYLAKIDGTENKKRLGGNLILVLSLAFARLMAESKKLELYNYIGFLYRGSLHKTNPTLPRLVVNVINGGAHSESGLEFQEFQIIPRQRTLAGSLALAKEAYKKLGDNLKKRFGDKEVAFGDEGGYSAPFLSNEQALAEIKETAREFAFREKMSFDLSLDVAASNFYDSDLGTYRIGDENLSGKMLSDYYEHLIPKYGLVAIEDPFHEEAFADFASFNKRKGIYVIADDLTVTNPGRIQMAVNADAADVMVVKPNQVGSLTETIRAAQMAHKNGWQLLVSHRSGETEDDFIADLAVGLNAWGIKAGAPVTPFRMAKYRRLLEIEKVLHG